MKIILDKKNFEDFCKHADLNYIGLHRDREKHYNEIQQLFKQGKKYMIDDVDLKTIINTLWAFRFWGNKEYIFQEVITDGIEKFRRYYSMLLNEKYDVVTRFDRMLKSVRRFGSAAISELLTLYNPEKYAIRNRRSCTGLLRLGISNTLSNKTQIDGKQYIEYCNILSELKNQLNKIRPVFKSFYDLDYFLYYIQQEKKETAYHSNSCESLVIETTHEDIQFILLEIGHKLGLKVWPARNDRSALSNRGGIDELHLLDKLPRQFDEQTQNLIEHIDVLWLKGNTFVAAFEIEHTTSIYSGLLRMSDLVAVQPNLNIPLYIVAPDKRRNKVLSEIGRPTFSNRAKPLKSICRYLSYSALQEIVDKYGSALHRMMPEIINDYAVKAE